jgi:Arc/MetJ-type ribon-helix-helix transcriptional regulator
MSTERVTVSLPGEIRQSAQRIADGLGVSFSSVVSDALAGWLRSRLVDAWLAEHQENHGAFDEDELRALATEAGVPYLPARAADPAA